jgi:uncharacterized membrane protein YfcA
VVGGIYGIGGGSILGPILVGRGMPVAHVAPAALASTFLTSIAGAGAYAVLSLTTSGDIAPEWGLGLLCGLGGLAGGYLGARLQPRLPETALRFLLGARHWPRRPLPRPSRERLTRPTWHELSRRRHAATA